MTKLRKLICGDICVVSLFLLLIWCLPTKEDFSLKIEYARSYDNNFNAQLFWASEKGYDEGQSSYVHVEHNRVELKIGDDIASIQELRLDPTDSEEATAITSVQIRNCGIGVAMIPVRELLSNAQFHFIEEPMVIRGVLSVEPQSNDPQVVMDRNMIEKYFTPCLLKFKWMTSIWILLAGIVFGVCVLFLNVLKSIMFYIGDRYDIITRVVLLIALFCVSYMAFHSFDYAHPDENMSKAAVDYYMTHWKPADIRSETIADSFSLYGYSRLGEITFYYFLAGKVAWLAQNMLGINKYYRVFNILLFAIMVGIYWMKGKENRHLFLMLGLTPQIWYIFSYTTSDGWDYFLSFLILYQLTGKDSIFNRAMELTLSNKIIWPLITNGVIYGMLFLGKKNYYFIFVASFFFLLYKFALVETQKGRIRILIKYGIVLAVCVTVFFGVKWGDSYRYNEDKGKVIADLRSSYADNIAELDEEEPQGIWAGVNMRGRGIELGEILGDFTKRSYWSFTGMYGWMENESPYMYYIIIGVLYGIALVILWKAILEEKGMQKKILFTFLMGLNGIVFSTSLWHAWTSDFQPQGRYLFAINFILGICCYLYNKKFFNNVVRIVLCTISFLSLYSFIFIGIFYLI
jgi:Predicted membrane protein